MKYHVAFSKDLKRNSYPGVYITIEGIDGSGKSTQLQKLKEYFAQKGRTVVLTSEPRDNLPTGDIMRQILAAEIHIPSIAYQFIYSANRAINHQTIVEPALQNGSVVISHRSFWSAIAYGIVDKSNTSYSQKNIDAILVAQGILSYYHQFLVSDYTFYLHISVDTAMKRLSSMDKQLEIYEKKEKLAKIAMGYNWIVKNFPREVTTINGEQSPEKVTQEIISITQIIKKL